MGEEMHAWRCACGARGTLAYETAIDEGESSTAFACPKCRSLLEDCRPTRRARRGPKTGADDGRPVAPADAPPLSDEDVARSAREWETTQQQLGNLGVMAESNWALDWAERLLRELRRRRTPPS